MRDFCEICGALPEPVPPEQTVWAPGVEVTIGAPEAWRLVETAIVHLASSLKYYVRSGVIKREYFRLWYWRRNIVSMCEDSLNNRCRYCNRGQNDCMCQLDIAGGKIVQRRAQSYICEAPLLTLPGHNGSVNRASPSRHLRRVLLVLDEIIGRVYLNLISRTWHDYKIAIRLAVMYDITRHIGLPCLGNATVYLAIRPFSRQTYVGVSIEYDKRARAHVVNSLDKVTSEFLYKRFNYKLFIFIRVVELETTKLRLKKIESEMIRSIEPSLNTAECRRIVSDEVRYGIVRSIYTRDSGSEKGYFKKRKEQKRAEGFKVCQMTSALRSARRMVNALAGQEISKTDHLIIRLARNLRVPKKIRQAIPKLTSDRLQRIRTRALVILDEESDLATFNDNLDKCGAAKQVGIRIQVVSERLAKSRALCSALKKQRARFRRVGIDAIHICTQRLNSVLTALKSPNVSSGSVQCQCCTVAQMYPGLEHRRVEGHYLISSEDTCGKMKLSLNTRLLPRSVNKAADRSTKKFRKRLEQVARPQTLEVNKSAELDAIENAARHSLRRGNKEVEAWSMTRATEAELPEDIVALREFLHCDYMDKGRGRLSLTCPVILDTLLKNYTEGGHYREIDCSGSPSGLERDNDNEFWKLGDQNSNVPRKERHEWGSLRPLVKARNFEERKFPKRIDEVALRPVTPGSKSAFAKRYRMANACAIQMRKESFPSTALHTIRDFVNLIDDINCRQTATAQPKSIRLIGGDIKDFFNESDMAIAVAVVTRLVRDRQSQGYNYYCAPRLEPPKPKKHSVEKRGYATGQRPRVMPAGFHKKRPSYRYNLVMPLDYVLRIVERAIRFPIARARGKVWVQTRGTPQGHQLATGLATAYASPQDLTDSERAKTAHLGGGRYVDDAGHFIARGNPGTASGEEQEVADLFTENRYEGCRLLLEEDGMHQCEFLGLVVSPRGPIIHCEPKQLDFSSIAHGRSALTNSQLTGIVCGTYCRIHDYASDLLWDAAGPQRIYEAARGFFRNGFPESIILSAAYKAAIPGVVKKELLKCFRSESVEY